MNRRRFLTTVGTATTLGVAGCMQSPEGEEEETTTIIEETTTTTTEETTTTTAEETTTTTAEGETTTTEGGAAAEAPNTIQMVTKGGDYYFDPIGLFVEQGETIEWVIESGAHSTTAYASTLDAAEVTRIPENAEPWNSGTLTDEGASFTHTFETKGTYDYFCIPHKTLGMIGRLVVGEPGDVEGDPPDGDVPTEQAIVDEGAISYDEWKG